MIFVSGIHGVGKTFFSKKVKEHLDIDSYTASGLIEKFKGETFSTDKKIVDISENQQILLKALKEKDASKKEFILDGHFCLLNNGGGIERIPMRIFEDLSPKAILLLTEKAEIIVQRRYERDGIKVSVKEVEKLQTAEKEYAKEVVDNLKIPLFISGGIQDVDKAIDFILQYA